MMMIVHKEIVQSVCEERRGVPTSVLVSDEVLIPLNPFLRGGPFCPGPGGVAVGPVTRTNRSVGPPWLRPTPGAQTLSHQCIRQVTKHKHVTYSLLSFRIGVIIEGGVFGGGRSNNNNNDNDKNPGRCRRGACTLLLCLPYYFLICGRLGSY